jgi:hypothetical protein
VLKGSVLKLTIIGGILILGVGIYSIRSSLKKTPDSLRGRAKQLTSGARLRFVAGEGERVVAKVGPVGQAQVVEYIFTFTNLGVVKAELNQVEVVEGPIAVVDYSQNVLPSEEGGIAVEFTPYGLQGVNQGVILVHSNDADYPKRELVLQVEVSEAL